MAATIRRMNEEDAAGVRDLVCRTIDVSYREAYSSEARAFFKNYHDHASIASDAREGCSLVMFAGDRLIGTGTLRGGEIKRVFVDPNEQGKGYGGAIMRALIARAELEGLRTVTLDASLVSRAIYEHLGFRAVRDGSIELGGGLALDYVVMALDL